MAADLFGSWNWLALGREGCFESASVKVDAAAVCHEVRSVVLAAGERMRVSFRVAGRPQRGEGGPSEQDVEVGEICRLKSLTLDSSVMVSVWAEDADRAVAAAKFGGPTAPRRACGEVRIPLRHLVSKYDGALYHSWLALDSPGLSDSVASIGLVSGDEGEALSQALLNAPRQLIQPKVCLSLCKIEDLGPSGQPLWVADAPRAERVARWGPLLRSQQQHVVMCTAQHLQGMQRGERAPATQQLSALEAQSAEQTRELQALREQLQMSEKGADRDDEISRQRALAEQAAAEVAELQEELAKIGEEANSKIEAANVRIRALRAERDDAVRDVERQSLDVRRLQEDRDNLMAERAKLSEQKEALLKIVEDLHETCVGAGVELTGMAGRKSLDSFRFP